MYIKDKQTGKVRKYGENHHDSLRISDDGTYLTYEHLQCGDGSIAGNKEHSGFLFCDEEGKTPEEDEMLCRYGADAYFNIGGWSSLIEDLLTNNEKMRYNKGGNDEILDSNVTKAIKDILRNGNDAVIRRKGNGIIVLEDSRKTKLDTSVIGRE